MTSVFSYSRHVVSGGGAIGSGMSDDTVTQEHFRGQQYGRAPTVCISIVGEDRLNFIVGEDRLNFIVALFGSHH